MRDVLLRVSRMACDLPELSELDINPLLADGDYTWNDARTELTFKLKPAAKWSDGTPVTADDVAYTWATHVKYNTPTGASNVDYIADIVAVDPQTVVVKAKLDDAGKAVNPLLVAAYVSSNYVIQKAWTQALEERTGGDATALMADPAEDVVYSGPYHKYFTDDSKVVLVRDDNYWGQDASMWGKLPAPKYLAHVIYKDNAAGTTALQAGEVDVSQQFNSNVQDLWLKDNLPISTYLPDAPYGIGASLPTAFYNLKAPGLDQLAVRKAIAIAVDYPTIIANAMTNQSATFDQVPRSLMNPTPGEQAAYDHDAVKDLQWVGNDIEGAKKLLEEYAKEKGLTLPLKVKLATKNDLEEPEIAQALKEMAAPAGFDQEDLQDRFLRAASSPRLGEGQGRAGQRGHADASKQRERSKRSDGEGGTLVSGDRSRHGGDPPCDQGAGDIEAAAARRRGGRDQGGQIEQQLAVLARRHGPVGQHRFIDGQLHLACEEGGRIERFVLEYAFGSGHSATTFKS